MNEQSCAQPAAFDKHMDGNGAQVSDAMWRGLAWLAMLALVVGNFYHASTIVHFGAGAGVLALLLTLREWWDDVAAERWAKWPLLAFLGSAIFNTVYPAWPDTELMVGSLHALWTSLEALISVLLAFYLLQTRRDFTILFQLLLLSVFVFVFWAPLDFWGRGGFEWGARMAGAKGSAFNLSMVLYMLSYIGWCLVFSRTLLHDEVPGWARRFGYAVPFLILQPILTLELPAFDHVGWVDGWMRYLPKILLCLGGCLWWRCMAVERARGVLVGLTLLLIGFSIAWTGTRSALLLFLLAGGLLLLMGRMLTRRTVLLFTVVCLGGLVFLASHPRFQSMTSMRHRLYIWEGALGVIEESFPFGIGYGKKSFSDAWTRHRPDPNDYGLLECKDIAPADLQDVGHAHNLWLQLMAERGIVGFLAFHWLWIAAGIYLFRVAYPANKEGQKARGGTYVLIVQAACIAVVLLALEGLIEFPLYRSNERLMWFVAGLGVVAAARLRGVPADSDNAQPATDNER